MFLLMLTPAYLRNSEKFLKRAAYFSLAEHLQRSRLVEVHRPLQLCRLNLRIHLRGLDSRVAEEPADLLEVMLLAVDLHRHTVLEVIRLHLGIANPATVHLAQPPNVLPGLLDA